MIRLFNILAVAALLGCAAYAYNISYQTIYYAEQQAKAKQDIAKETDEISFLKAEWAHLVRPQRVAELADKNLSLQPLALNQIVSLQSLPAKAPGVDMIGHKLDDLGLAQPTATPHSSALIATTTPKAVPTSAHRAVTSQNTKPTSIRALLMPQREKKH